MTKPWLIGHLQPKRNWASSVLITYPILRIWPRRATTCYNQFKGRHFSSDAVVIAVVETWLDGQQSDFFNGLQKLEQWAKKCIELSGEYVEYIPSLVTVACFLPDRAKDLSATPRV